MPRWKVLPVPDVGDDYDGHFRAIRLNSLGSLFWFAKHVLGKNRLVSFHKYLCGLLESDDLRLVLEVPMGMFKTTISTALSIWWALNFLPEDEHEMAKLGYGKRWMQYMKSVHNPNTRTLVAHEIDKRAVDIGKEVDFAYQDNDLFRQVFAGILPDRNCEWNDHAKYQKRNRDLMIDPTNPTYAYCGVGHALQGVRADNTIEDDIFGRKAQKSMLTGDGSIVEDTIRWHRQLTTRMDTSGKATRQLVTANRWGHADLNSWIRKNQPQFTFETHDAEGGCDGGHCKIHPKHGVPIFPEEFSWEVLQQKKIDNPPYDYAHFYRNLSTLPEECIFREEWLHYFKFQQSRPELPLEDPRNILLLRHEVSDGDAIEDTQPGGFVFRIIIDPNHEKKQKRTKHVILVVAYDPESTRIYLLDLWAVETSYTELVDQLYKTARRWRLDDFWMGEGAAELLNFYLTQRNRIERQKLRMNTFPDEDSLTGMKNRIGVLEPIFRRRQIWCHRNQKEFVGELSDYPAGELNILDAFSHFSETMDIVAGKEVDDFIRQQQEVFQNRGSGPGGY